MSANVKLGNDTITGVDTVKLENADSAGNYVSFNLGISGGYTIKFIADGSDYSVVQVASGGYVEKPVNPTKTGYQFMGWGSSTTATTYQTFPYAPNADATWYAVFVAGSKASVAGLGNSSPTTATFTRDTTFPTSFDEWTDSHGNIFVKIPTMYRKIDAVLSGQITAFSIATAKLDNDYEPYPVFVDVNDNNRVLDYVYIGKYCYNSTTAAGSSASGTSTLAIGTARSLAQAVGTGYQQYDVHFQKLFQDLALVISQTVNFNTGTAIANYMGIYNLDGSIWVDGIAANSNTWVASNDPSKYVDSATSSTDGYYALGYAQPTTSSWEIRALGYDTSHPFINYPKTVIENSSYTTYYCDSYFYSSGSHPVFSNVGNSNADSGLWCLAASFAWTGTSRARLCYRPISS